MAATPPPIDTRRAAVDELVQLFAASRSEQRGRVVLVHGGEGCGSSYVVGRLRDELGRRQLAHTWWSGRCGRATPLAYEPIVGLLRSVPGDAGAWFAEAAAVGGADAVDVALLAGLVRRCRTAAETAPLVMVVDDVDGADPSTVRLLAGLAPLLDDAPVLLVLCGRSAPAVQVQHTIEIAPMSHDEMHAVVQGSAPHLDDATVEAVVRAANGRPAIALSLARGGDADRTLGAVLTTAGSDAATAMVAAAIVDGWSSDDQVATIAGLPVATFSELLGRGLLVPSPHPGGGSVPVNAAWTAAAERLLPGEQRDLAARLAPLLDDTAPAAVAALAWERGGDRPTASRRWLTAADEARASFATATAASAMRRAVDLGDDAVLLEVGLAAGRLALAAGDRVGADELAARLVPRLPRDDERSLLAALTLRYRARSEAGLDGADEQLDLAVGISTSPCPERVDALALDALRHALDDTPRALASAALALQLAEGLDDPAALAAAGGALGLTEAIGGDLATALTHFDVALQAAARLADDALEARLASNRVYVLWRAGRPLDVERTAAIELERLRVRGLLPLGDALAVSRCVALLLLGRLDAMHDAFATARSIPLSSDALALLDLLDAERHVLCGQPSSAVELIERVRNGPSAASPEVLPDLHITASQCSLALGDRRAAADQAAAGLRACGADDVIARARLTVAWWRASGVDDKHPTELLDPIAIRRDAGRAVGAEAAALLSQIEAHQRRDVEAWRAASAAWEVVPAPLEALRCRAAVEAVQGDLDALAQLADSARAAGAQGVAAEIDEAWRAAGGRRAPQRSAGVLTDRELEVLRCVAEGLTNRAIGERLYISTRTVGVHLERCMTKLAVSTRGAAVHEARRLGLLTS